MLKLTILGCGSSAGCPRADGYWGNCDPTNERNRRQKCSLLVQKYSKVNDGKEIKLTNVVIDTGSDIRNQLFSANVKHLDAVLYTHSHADHIHGIDDLRSFYLNNNKIRVPVYMDDKTFKNVSSSFGYCFSSIDNKSYPGIIEHNLINHGEYFTISGAGGDITFLPILHNHGQIESLGFRVEDCLYSCDLNMIPEKSLNLMKGLKLWIVDALQLKPHKSHFCVDETLYWSQNKIKPGKTILTNMHCSLDYKELTKILPEGFVAAYDGMTIMIDNERNYEISP